MLLVVVLLAIDQVGGRLLDHYYLKVRAGSEYKTVYGVEKSKEDLLIMGSSRAYHHYVTAMLEQSFGMEGYNLGRDGAGVLYHYAVYKTICERKKPKMLLLDLNPDELLARDVTYELLYQLLPHYGKNDYIKDVVNLRSRFEWLKARSRLYRYNSQLFYIAVDNVKHPGIHDSKGYLALEGSVKNKPEIVTWNTPKMDTLLFRYFEKILEEAHSNGTRVVVCISPIYKRYSDSAPGIVQVKRICQQQNVTMLDYSQDTTFLNHPEYFRDVLHLNDAGAHLYTRLLIDALQRHKP